MLLSGYFHIDLTFRSCMSHWCTPVLKGVRASRVKGRACESC